MRSPRPDSGSDSGSGLRSGLGSGLGSVGSFTYCHSRLSCASWHVRGKWRTLRLNMFLLLFISVALLKTIPVEGSPQNDAKTLCALYDATGGDSWQWRGNPEASTVWNCTNGGVGQNPCHDNNTMWEGEYCVAM